MTTTDLSNYKFLNLDLVCLIVTFNPQHEIFTSEIKSIVEENFMVFIVDNGSNCKTLELISAITQEYSNNIRLIKLGCNTGIAAAQNKGIQQAINLGADFVLLLDHDSIPSPGLIAKLLVTAQEKIAHSEKLAAIGARTVDPRTALEHGFAEMHYGLWRKKRCLQLDGKLIPCQFLNASGSLIYLPAWQDIGKFNEAFFIDHVETEWYMRAQAKGYKVFGLCFGQLEHYMGDDVVRYWFFGWRHMPHRSPERHYTIIRNSLWMYHFPYVPFAWKLNNITKLLFSLAYFSLFDVERDKQFKFILRGFVDGLRGPPR